MVTRAVRTERMRCSNFVSFRRYLIRRHAHRPMPGFDPGADLHAARILLRSIVMLVSTRSSDILLSPILG
jgi:hypothetical protein